LVEEVEKNISDLLGAGTIRRSQSPYRAPLVFVRKKTGELRMCVDYRRINQMTVADAWPVPHIEDVLEKFAENKVMSCLDMSS